MRYIAAVAFSRPMLALMRGLERLAYLFERYRTHCRAQTLFPGKIVGFDVSTSFKYPERIQMGDHVLIGPGVTIGAMGGVVIEDHVRISESALIETASGNFKAELPYPHKSRPIHLGYGVSICAHAVVIGGVRIGAQAIVTAGSVVTKDVPANAIVRGNPAQIVGYRVRPPRHLRTLKAA